jgi:hypothetical protein
MSVSNGSRLMLASAGLVLCGCAVAATTPVNRQDPQAVAAAPLGLRRGLYVLVPSSVYGFRANNRNNRPRFCSLGGITYPAGNIAFDTKGRMIVPDYASSTITVYAAPTRPKACGRMLGVIQDRYGQPVDAASLDAVSGRIVVVAARPGGHLFAPRRLRKFLEWPLPGRSREHSAVKARGLLGGGRRSERPRNTGLLQGLQ